MDVYADYEFYIGTYKGTSIAESDFPRFAREASAFVDQATFGRAAPIVGAATDLTTIESIKLATCAVAEEIQKLEASGGAVQSETVGRISVTYVSRLTDDARKLRAARLYLWDTGLLYRGIDE